MWTPVIPRPAARLDRRRPAASQVFDALRAEIISLRLAPGTPLSRGALADRFGVSQTPIRDALLRLEQQGLIEIYPQSSTVVSLIDLRQARQSHFLRIAIEIEVARTIAGNPDGYDLSDSEAILEDMHAAWKATGDAAALRPPDQGFHAALCDTVGHGELWDLIVARSGNVDRLRSINVYPGKVEKILKEHGQLLSALRRGDADAAESTIRLHLSDTLGAADEIKSASPHYFSSH